MTIADVAAKASKIVDTLKALPFDGGPSVTRWVFLRIAEAVTFGWLCLVGALIYGLVAFHHADPAIATLVGTLAAAMFGFASNNMNIKNTTEAQLGSGKSSTTSSTPLTSSTEVK